MAIYKCILLAVDLSEDSTHIARHAQSLARTFGAELHLVHVLEPMPLITPANGDPGMPLPPETTLALAEMMEKKLKSLAADLGLPDSACHAETGNPKTEILRLAQEKKADLIVLGSKERHGLSLLVDFTEDAVLHRASCDVLAVRV